MKLPWGTYRGHEVADVPTEYLLKITRSIKGDDGLLREIERELAYRQARAAVAS